jgi:hypothetical protein
VSAIATDGTALAYPNGDFTSLWWSPSLTAPPHRLFTTGNAASHVDNSVRVSGLPFSLGPASGSAVLVKVDVGD